MKTNEHNIELEIVIGEFAQNIANDDIRVLYNSSNCKRSYAEMKKYVASSFMALFATNGNSKKIKEGVIPIDNNQSLIAYSSSTTNTVRLLCFIVPSDKVKEAMIHLEKNEPVKDKLVALRIALAKNDFNLLEIESLIMSFRNSFNQVYSDNDELERIANVFVDEI